jgi:hypothetical protein
MRKSYVRTSYALTHDTTKASGALVTEGPDHRTWILWDQGAAGNTLLHHELTWKQELLPPLPNSKPFNVGALAIDANGAPHLAIPRADHIEYVRWNNAFESYRIHTNRAVGKVILAIDATDAPHMAWAESGMSYGRIRSGVWQVANFLASTEDGFDFQLDAQDQPCVFNSGSETFITCVSAQGFSETIVEGIRGPIIGFGFDGQGQFHAAFAINLPSIYLLARTTTVHSHSTKRSAHLVRNQTQRRSLE